MQNLTPLVDRRFQSFAEATDAVLDALASSLPGSIVLNQNDTDADLCRVFDSLGPSFAGTERGMIMPVDGDRVGVPFLVALGVKDVVSVPVELSAGLLAGVLMAISPDEGAYAPEHTTMLAIAARVLGYEWERVRTSAELRILRQQARAGQQYDPETDLPNRAGFLGLLEREWRLARRGTLPSTVVAIRVEMSNDEVDRAAALKHLAVKDAAEVLISAARNTDHVGRLAEWTMGVVMIGCDDEAHVTPLINRYSDALRRATESRGFDLSVFSGAQRLIESSSAQLAMELAETAANERFAALALSAAADPELG